MRTLLSLALLPMLSQVGVCSSSTEAPAPVAAVQIGTAPVASKHGGTVVAVDDVQLELIVKGSGEIVAYPVQGTANAAPTLTTDAQVTVQVPVESGGTRPVQLVYVPATARFEGQVVGAQVVTQPANVEVTVVSRGKRRHRRVERVVVAPATRVEVRPAVVAAPRVDVRVQPAPNVEVRGPAAQVRVEMPRVDVRIGGPVVRVDSRDDHGMGRGHDDHDDHRGRGHDNGRHRGWDQGRGNPHRGRH